MERARTRYGEMIDRELDEILTSAGRGGGTERCVLVTEFALRWRKLSKI
jgi:hypothetical protein